jgi:hypothetical protein
MFGMGRIPRHCRFCEKRFYVSSRFETSPAAEEVDDQPEREA